MLDSIDYVAPLNAKDLAVLDEVKEVLLRRRANERFGGCLLHGHPAVGEDENHLFVERSDIPNRQLSARLQKRSEVDPSRVVETAWKFDDAGGMTAVWGCQKKLDGTHA